MAVISLTTHEVVRLHLLRVPGDLELLHPSKRRGLKVFLFHSKKTEEELTKLINQFEVGPQVPLS